MSADKAHIVLIHVCTDSARHWDFELPKQFSHQNWEASGVSLKVFGRLLDFSQFSQFIQTCGKIQSASPQSRCKGLATCRMPVSSGGALPGPLQRRQILTFATSSWKCKIIHTWFSKLEAHLRWFSKASFQLTGAYNQWRQKAMELMHIPDPYSFPTGNYLYSAPFLSILGPTGAI